MAKTAQRKQKVSPEKETSVHQPASASTISKSGETPTLQTERQPVTFTTEDGEVIIIPDTPVNMGRATAIASEKTLGKIWGTSEEEKGCQNLLKGI